MGFEGARAMHKNLHKHKCLRTQRTCTRGHAHQQRLYHRRREANRQRRYFRPRLRSPQVVGVPRAHCTVTLALTFSQSTRPLPPLRACNGQISPPGTLQTARETLEQERWDMRTKFYESIRATDFALKSAEGWGKLWEQDRRCRCWMLPIVLLRCRVRRNEISHTKGACMERVTGFPGIRAGKEGVCVGDVRDELTLAIFSPTQQSRALIS